MKRTHKKVAAAVVLAAVSGGAVVGCRALYGDAGPAAGAGAGAALASGEAGVKTIAAQTVVAEKQVQKAIPHSDVKGQAYLEAASDAHELTLATTGEVEAALDTARQQVQTLQRQLGDAAAETQREREKLLEIRARWYVVWGERLEKAFWTAAITWLVVSIASALLGTGSPVAWIGKLRSTFAAWRTA